ncbi:MAG: OsmC family protein [Thiothrix sp.]|nr:OsmC family protein [Thiothrix sp.]HPQ97192.1 OsmC family protein [Thiolinea sp.]
MSEHQSTIHWQRRAHPQYPETYCRNHTAELNGGQEVLLSAGLEFKGDPQAADPEQMLITAVASCHMLFFLAIAEVKGFTVERYNADVIGYLDKGENGKLMITKVVLRPLVAFAADRQPSEPDFMKIMNSAHRQCFIANSIKAELIIEPRMEVATA